ncbi:MAG: uroporphyrinogen decarboxylase [Peptococcaceae bacterium]|nr:uroporphyrinogen decarboxylase [Peptococcaceae bacterium]
MVDTKIIQQERISLYEDLFRSKVPKRVPLNVSVTYDYVSQFAGVDMGTAKWDSRLLFDGIDKLAQTLYSDICPVTSTARYPSFYEILESQAFVMGSNGFIQHPEVVGMLAEEYDYLIEKPFDCLVEKVLPRQYKALTFDDPLKMAFSLTKSIVAHNNEMAQFSQMTSQIIEKYGYYPGNPPGANGFTEAPFDFIADMLRGFREVSMDVRRIPGKLAEACEAVYPIVLKKGMPSVITEFSTVFIPLHMPTYMREKDFAKLWWPTFKKLVEEYASLGVHCELFCETDWTRYLDYLAELPTNTIMWFEYGDAKLIKEKLGKKHIIKGLYPISLLKTGTKEECLAKAKELIDILAPGGRYLFTTDKSPLILDDIKLENYCAVTEFVRDYAVYDNAGESSGLVFNKDDYQPYTSARKLESRYLTEWGSFNDSDYRTTKLQGLDNVLFNYLIGLLV